MFTVSSVQADLNGVVSGFVSHHSRFLLKVLHQYPVQVLFS